MAAKETKIQYPALAILYGEDPNLLQVSVRLTPDTADLAPVILHETEREARRVDAAD